MHKLENPTEQLENSAVNSKIARRLIPFVMLCCLFNYLDRQNIGFAKIAFSKEIGISESQYGIGGGLFFVGYLFFEIPNNMLTYRIGFRASLSRIIVVWGFVCLGLAFIQSVNHFYIVRFLLGAAEGGFFPGILLYLTFWIPASLRAKVTTMYFVACSAAGIIGGPLSGLIMQNMENVGGFASWRWLFIIEGVPTIILGVCAYFWLTEKPADASWLSASEKASLIDQLNNELSPTGKAKFGSLKAALRDANIYALVGMAFATFSSSVGLFLWIPSIIIRSSGVTSYWEIGVLSAIPFMVAAAVQICNGVHSDRTREHRWHVAIPACVASAGWALLPAFAASPSVSLALLTVAAAGTLGAQSVFYAMPATLLTGPAAAVGIALVTSIGALGGVVSPMVVGKLNDVTGSFGAGQLYFAIILLLASVILLFKFGASRRSSSLLEFVQQ